MTVNQFESSRIADGTLNSGAQKLSETTEKVPEESSAISRDDVRDGFAEKPGTPARKLRRVLAASTLTEDRVRNPVGEDLGRIEEIMLDLTGGRIAYAVLSFGGFLGIGDKLFAVPWSAFRLDLGEHQFILDVDRQVLEKAPGFDKSNWPDMADAEFSQAINRHYGKTPYWEEEFTDSGDYVGDNLQPSRSLEHEPITSYRPAEKH